jgi:Leucine-rich repeat (LRR) protein
MRLSNLSVVSGQVFMLPNYKQLKLLDLRNNRLQEIPGEICTLQQLATLKVDYNYLVALPFSLGNLSELVCLSASQNRLIELPDSLFRHDSKLHTLLVNDNKITRV